MGLSNQMLVYPLIKTILPFMTDERENILDLRSEIIFEIILFLSKICFDLIYIF